MQKRHNTISFNLTTSSDQCDLFKSFLNIISEVVLIFCFLNQLFFLGGGGWEEEVNYNMIGPPFHDTLHKSCYLYASQFEFECGLNLFRISK